MILKLSELRRVAFTKFTKESEKTIVAYQKLISHSVIRLLSLYPSLPMQRMLQMYPASHSYFMSIDRPTVVLKRFFWKFFQRTLFKRLRHLQSFLVAFNEKAQNIEMSKASFVEVVSCFATAKARIQRDHQMKISSQVKSALRKLRDREKARIVTVY